MAPVNTALSRTESWSLTALSLASIAVLVQTFQGDGAPLVASIAFSGLAFAMSYAMIRWLGGVFMKAGLKGKDLSKRDRREIPETMGAVCAVVYLLAVICFIPFPFYKDIVAATSGGGNRDLVLKVSQVETGRFLHRFPHGKLASYLSAILSLQTVIILGLGDDLFDIRWRHKVLIPAFASIPMLIVYFVDFGVTSIVIPTPLRPYLGELFDLGWLYYAYMAAISIFAPNSINILAGVNGIEVGQSVVIALLILVNDILYLSPGSLPFSLPTTSPPPLPLSTPTTPPMHPALDSHLFSIYLLLPFLAVSLALLKHNWYPAQVFVGDTYCYFAGMVFAVVAIQGHFSKTLLLLIMPQVANFIYSAPQLFGVVPCPRHRLPKFNSRTGLLENSWADFTVPGERLADELDGPATSISSSSETETKANANGNGKSHTHKKSKSLASIAAEHSSHAVTGRHSTLRTPVQTVLKVLARLHLLRVETDAATGEVLRSTNMTLLNLWIVWFGPMREDRLALGLLAAQCVCGMLGLWVRHRLALWIFTADNW